MGTRQSHHRPKNPKPIRLTERDNRILETIHAFDGVISLKQIDRLFFSGKGRTQPRARMRVLFHHGYVNMPDAGTIHKVPLGETVYWLGREGAKIVTSLYGKPLRDLSWRNQPRWSWLTHDLAVNDFRIDVMQACQRLPRLKLAYWIPEGQFLASPDTVYFEDRREKNRKRQIRPDAFFLIHGPDSDREAENEEFAFLLEIDMATHSNPRFAREKVRAGVAYLKSDVYRERFGLRYGRWLVVTTSEQRLMHLKAQTERAGGSRLFYFTTFDQISPDTLFTEPVWWRAGSDAKTKLMSSPA